MDNCQNCGKKGNFGIDIHNIVIRYESWEAYNCCCTQCAKESANKEGISDDEIIEIES